MEKDQCWVRYRFIYKTSFKDISLFKGFSFSLFLNKQNKTGDLTYYPQRRWDNAARP